MTLRQTIGDFLIIETKLENDNQTTSGVPRRSDFYQHRRYIFGEAAGTDGAGDEPRN
jgi:hypothetical protein